MAPVPSDIADIIQRKQQKYGRFVDTAEWEAMAEQVILPEARLSFFQPDGSPITVGKTTLIFENRKAYIDNISKSNANQYSTHVISYGDLEMTAPDEVKGVFAMLDSNSMKQAFGMVRSRGGGHYHVTYRKRDNDWFIVELRLQRSFEEVSWGFALALGLVNLCWKFGVDLMS